MENLPNALTKRILELEGSPLTEAQREEVSDAYSVNPGSVERALGGAEKVAHAAPYFISSVRRINREEATARTAPPGRAQRHDLDAPSCNDCGDTGFVILTADISDSARVGDAAPCHCAVGITKQRSYGTVHYGREQYEPVVIETPLTSLRQYAQTEAGKADPNLSAMRAWFRKNRISEEAKTDDAGQ